MATHLPIGQLLAVLLASGLVLAEIAVPLQTTLSRRHSEARYKRSANGTLQMYSRIWLATVSLGTPPQDFKMLLDTGSADILIESSHCAESACYGSSQRYDLAASSSGTTVTCDSALCRTRISCPTTGICAANSTFADASWASSYITSELVGFGGLWTAGTIGAIYSDAANFVPAEYSGLWGIGFQELSAWGADSSMVALLGSAALPQTFTTCMSANGGFLILGEDYTQPGGVSYQWTPVVEPARYSVEWQGAALAGKAVVPTTGAALPPSPRGTFFDTGTTLWYIYAPIFDLILQAFNALCNGTTESKRLVGLCSQASGFPVENGVFSADDVWFLQPDEVAAYPDLQLQFKDGATVTLKGADYLIPVLAETGQTGYQFAGQRDQRGWTVFGATFMARLRVTHDIANRRLGFAPASSCRFGGGTAQPPSSTQQPPFISAAWVPAGLLLLAGAMCVLLAL